MVRASKLQQSDAWISNLGASKKRRNPKCELHKSLVQPRTPRGEIVLEASCAAGLSGRPRWCSMLRYEAIHQAA